MTTRNAPSAHRPTRIFHGPIDNGRFRASAVSSNRARSDGRASRTIDAVRAELAAGHPVICSVVPGDFTTTRHFIVLAGLTEDGQLIVRDPNSERNSSQPWEIERVLEQCANLWAFIV